MGKAKRLRREEVKAYSYESIRHFKPEKEIANMDEEWFLAHPGVKVYKRYAWETEFVHPPDVFPSYAVIRRVAPRCFEKNPIFGKPAVTP